MQHVQGYTGGHWTPPSGKYSLRIASVASRATANKTKMQNVSTLLTISMAIGVRRYYTARIARWRRFVDFINATKRRHWASTRSDVIKGTHQLRLFRTFHSEKKKQLTCWPLITIGVWQIKLTRSTLLFFHNTLLGWHCCNNRFLFPVFPNNLLKYL
jgi:hypothetical protein